MIKRGEGADFKPSSVRTTLPTSLHTYMTSRAATRIVFQSVRVAMDPLLHVPTSSSLHDVGLTK